MKKYLIILTCLILFACHNSSGEINSNTNVNVADADKALNEPNASIAKDISADDFNALINKGNYQLIDVRTPEEYNGGKIENAININFLGDSFTENISELDFDKVTLVYCQSGGRSGKAMTAMKELGFKEVYNLIGGYGQWPFKQ